MGIEDSARIIMVGALALLVMVFFLDAITPTLFNKLENSIAFPFGETTKTLVQLLSFVFAALLLLAAFKVTRPGEPQQRSLA